jgi:hypothetical protein
MQVQTGDTAFTASTAGKKGMVYAVDHTMKVIGGVRDSCPTAASKPCATCAELSLEMH